MKCRKCHCKLTKKERFCPQCGVRVAHTGGQRLLKILIVCVLLAGVGFVGWKLLKVIQVQIAIKRYETIVEEISVIESAYLDEDGYVQVNDVPEILSTVNNYAKKLYEDGDITEYAYETDDSCVYMELEGWLGYLYEPSVEGFLSGGEESAIQIVTVEPFANEWGTLVGYAMNGGKGPDNAAETITKELGSQFVFGENYDNTEVSVETLYHISANSIIMWNGHGGYNSKTGSILSIGKSEKLKKYILKHQALFQDGSMVITNGHCCITPIFFEKHIEEGAFEGNLFYLNACSSLADGRLAQSIWDKGARSVIGNSSKVWAPYGIAMMYDFFVGLTQKKENGEYFTITEALAFAKEEEGDTDPIGNSVVLATYRDDFALVDMLKPAETEKNDCLDAYTRDCTYTWVVDPDIEADNIYYLNSNDAWENPINTLNKQLENNYGYAVIKKDENYGLIDMEGELLDGMDFQSVSTHLSGYHVTYSEPRYDSMTGTETTEFDLADYGLTYAFGHGDASFLYGGLYFWNDGLSQYYLANEMPEPDTTIAVQEISETFAADSSNHKISIREQALVELCKNISGKYAIYTDGNLATDFVYDKCGSYAEGLMAVCQNGKWGYVDRNGEIIIPIEYDASWKEYVPYENSENSETEDFCYAASDGYVVLCKKDKWELRDIQGKIVIQLGVFEEIRPVYDGKCWVKKNGKWGVIQIQTDTNQLNSSLLDPLLIGTWVYNPPNSDVCSVLKFSEDGTADYGGDGSDPFYDAAYHLEGDKIYIDIKEADATICLNVTYETHEDKQVLSVRFDDVSDSELHWMKQYIEGDYEKHITKATTETYQKVYGPLIQDVCQKYGENNVYHCYDIDKDGIKELIVQEGTCYQDYTYQFYTIKNNESIYLGEVSGFHCAFYKDENDGTEPYIIRSEGFQQQSVVSYIKIEDDKIVEELISSGYADTYYSNSYKLSSAKVSVDRLLEAEWYDG